MVLDSTPDIFQFKDYKHYLLSIYSYRFNKNPRYSLRAYARDLNISASRLTETLNRQSHLSTTVVNQISQSLKLDKKQTQYFGMLVSKSNPKSAIQKKLAEKYIDLHCKEKNYTALTYKNYQFFSNWHNVAVFLYLHLEPRHWKEQALSVKIGIPVENVEESLMLCHNLNLANPTEKGWVAKKKYLNAMEHLPSLAIRNYHKQMMKLAYKSIDVCPIQDRYLQSLSFSCNKIYLEKKIQQIQDFMQSLNSDSHLLDEKNNQIYTLSLQLFELKNHKK